MNKIKIEKSVEKHFEHRLENYTERQKTLTGEKINPFMKEMNEFLKGDEKILDVGCGAGYLLNSIKSEFPKTQLCGIDLTEKLLEVAGKEQDSSIKFQKGNATKIPFKDNSFDVVLFKNLLHHIVKENRTKSKNAAGNALREMSRVLRKNGKIFIYEECVSSEWKSNVLYTISKLCLKLGIEIPFLYIHKYVVVSFLTKKELKKMLSVAGFTIERQSEFPLEIRFKYKLTLILPVFMHGTKDVKIVGIKKADAK